MITKKRFVMFSALTVLLLSTVAGGVASAKKFEGIKVTPEQSYEGDYGAMGPGAPTREALTNRPIDCDDAHVTYCDLIPIEIVPPANLSDDRDIFFTIIELHWDDSTGSDLDLTFWDNAQSTGSHEKLGSSESTKNPELVRAANADLSEYNIVVVNTGGANTGYKIKVRITTDPFVSPSEAVAPDPPKQDTPEGEEEEPDFEAPEDLSGDPPVAPSTPSDPTLPPVEGGAVGGDEDFNFGFSDLDERITVNQEDFAAGGGAAPPPPQESVNPAVLLASLVGAPALVVGSGAAFAWKRRRELLV